MPSSRNFDGLAGLGIATSASFALGFSESSKTNEFHFVAFLNTLTNGVESAVEHALGLSLCKASFFGDLFDQLSFIHIVAPVVVQSCKWLVEISSIEAGDSGGVNAKNDLHSQFLQFHRELASQNQETWSDREHDTPRPPIFLNPECDSALNKMGDAGYPKNTRSFFDIEDSDTKP